MDSKNKQKATSPYQFWQPPNRSDSPPRRPSRSSVQAESSKAASKYSATSNTSSQSRLRRNEGNTIHPHQNWRPNSDDSSPRGPSRSSTGAQSSKSANIPSAAQDTSFMGQLLALRLPFPPAFSSSSIPRRSHMDWMKRVFDLPESRLIPMVCTMDALPLRSLYLDAIELHTVGDIKLPRRLLRPNREQVSYESLTTVHKDLPKLSLDYIRGSLLGSGHDLFEMLKRTEISRLADGKPIPDHLDVENRHPTSQDVPTHILAIVPDEQPTDPKETVKIALHLVHDIVLAFHCSYFPSRSFLPKPTHNHNPAKLSLPVIAIELPRPSMFPHLLRYLYTKDAGVLTLALLPLLPATFGLTPDSTRCGVREVARELFRSYVVAGIRDIALDVYGMWANACCLGIWDEILWDRLDFCWEVIVTAVRISEGEESDSDA